jgi:hypothetical protein
MTLHNPILNFLERDYLNTVILIVKNTPLVQTLFIERSNPVTASDSISKTVKG